MQLSIIVPVYNVEKYLPEFFRSLVRISPSVELLFINDGSTDGSERLIQKFCRSHKDLHARVISVENGGLGLARNIGLDNAEGDYIWFVDSDDVLDLRYLNKLLLFLTTRQPDMLQIDVEQFMDGEKVELSHGTPKFIQSSPEELFAELADARIENYAVGHIVRRDVYSKMNFSFPVGTTFEDVATKYRILSNCGTCYQTSFIFYWYRQRSDSIVHFASVKDTNDVFSIACQIEASTLPFSTTDKEKLVFRIFRLAYARTFDIRDHAEQVRRLRRKIKMTYIRVAKKQWHNLSVKNKMSLILMEADFFVLRSRYRQIVWGFRMFLKNRQG
ncbi:glycosyltransferase family 2 protein [Lacticaseibacillus hegangensis]|uniref:Glycosyltransferase family 2 protein n=1 Tax=Lacticaseibacillus hegangensis TaxID=2486010 RepID=A0ABW4D0J6_9LACO|nr:glycosyltransferase [Lacticaseibacillus hegangensis]